MQYAVFSEDSIVYVGDNATEAAEAFSSKGGVVLETFSSPEELREKFDAHTSGLESLSEGSEYEEICVEMFNKFFDVLDEIGVAERAEKLAVNARSLGAQAMQTAGDKLVWFGNLLKEVSK